MPRLAQHHRQHIAPKRPEGHANVSHVAHTPILAAVLVLAAALDAAHSQPAPRFGVTLEAARVWSARNDVRIPPVGGTDFSIVDLIRDARIALDQPGVAAENTDLGFVPLGHLKGQARFRTRWGWTLEIDGAAAPQGRAFDVHTTLDYRLTPRWMIAAGYRTLEGGADVDTVFTFAWLNSVVLRVGTSF